MKSREINQQPIIISEAQFNKYNPVVCVLGFEDIEPYIAIAQELHIVQLIGDSLMSEIQEQMVSNTLTDVNEKLIEVVAPCLACYAVYQAVPFHWLSLSRSDITISPSNEGAMVKVSDVAELRNYLRNRAIKLRGNIQEYITN